ASDVGGDRGVDSAQHVVDVVCGALRVIDIALVVGVGGADVGVLEGAVGLGPPRHHEQAALVLRHRDHDGDVVAHLLPRDRQVHALRRTDRVGVLALGHGADVVDPHAGGVDDDLGVDRELPGAGVDHDVGGAPSGVFADRHHLAAVRHGGA